MPQTDFSQPASATVSSSAHRIRQYAGIALVVVAYVGGILAWSWAVWTVDSDAEDPGPNPDTPKITVVDRGDLDDLGREGGADRIGMGLEWRAA